jgi:hypothetical protein
MEILANQKDSIHIEYYENGNKKVLSSIKDGKFNGYYKSFYKNGNIAKSGEMINNKKNSTWRYFNTNGTLEEVKIFDEDKLLFDMDTIDFSLSTIDVEEKNIKIDIPIHWDKITEYESPLLLTSQKKCDDSFVFCPSITITKEKLQNNYSFNGYVNISYQLLQKRLGYFKPVSKGNLIINGHPAFQLTYFMLVDDVKLGGITTWIYNDGYVYIITGMSINEVDSEFLKYLGLFQEISATFRMQ